MDVRGGEPGDAAAKVALQVPVWAVRVHGLLEGMDLTHNLCYAPTTSEQHEMGRHNKVTVTPL